MRTFIFILAFILAPKVSFASEVKIFEVFIRPALKKVEDLKNSRVHFCETYEDFEGCESRAPSEPDGPYDDEGPRTPYPPEPGPDELGPDL